MKNDKVTRAHKNRHIGSLFDAHKKTFITPLVSDAADPWVLVRDNTYYYCRSLNDTSISVIKAHKLENIGKRIDKIWHPKNHTNHCKQIWAPELHFFNGHWYIYFAADGGNNRGHRMFVLESENSNPEGTYRFKGKIAALTDRWAIDGTVLDLKGVHYFVWSGWEDSNNNQQNLYIAAMENPWTIKGDRVCISKPTYDWEQHDHPYVNEGPEILEHNNTLRIIYSASGSWTDYYCLGELVYQGGDVLNKDSWVKNPQPVFQGTSEVFAPGHASFVKGPDQSDWIVYHTAQYSGAGWKREVHAQKFTWNKNNTPNFGEPISSESLN